MKTKTVLATALAGLIAATSSANAAIITLSPDDVNRLNEFNKDTTDGAFFSTRQQATNRQFTVLTTTTATFLAALEAALGPLDNGANKRYQINSATLTVGADVTGIYDGGNNEYNVEAKAHLMLTTYEPGDVSWNNSDESAGTLWNGAGGTIDLVGGLDWNTSVIDTGVASDTGGSADNDTVNWFNFGSTVQSWVDGDSNPGLFFEDFGNPIAGSARHQAVTAAVQWTIDAIAVPEPSSTALLGLGGLALAMRRRRA